MRVPGRSRSQYRGMIVGGSIGTRTLPSPLSRALGPRTPVLRTELAPRVGIEPTLPVLETGAQPLYQRDIETGWETRIRT